MSAAGDMDLSVIVSTRNRRSALERFLGSLAKSSVSAGRVWELVLIDNGSSDGTGAVIASLATQARFAMQILTEVRRGKSIALNRGMRAARGRVLAFTDDDVLVDADWIERILDHFTRHPQSAIVGGAVRLNDPRDAAVGVRHSAVAASHDLATFSATAVPVGGNNMAMRAECCRRVGAFDELLGPGTRLAAGEDLDYVYRFVRAGYTIDYVPAIAVAHDHGRRTDAAVAEVRRGYLRGRGAFYAKHTLRGDALVRRWGRWEVQQLVSSRSLDALHDLVNGALRYCVERMRRKPYPPSP
jgi:GT2 family glycosyltransferase